MGKRNIAQKVPTHGHFMRLTNNKFQRIVQNANGNKKDGIEQTYFQQGVCLCICMTKDSKVVSHVRTHETSGWTCGLLVSEPKEHRFACSSVVVSPCTDTASSPHFMLWVYSLKPYFEVLQPWCHSGLDWSSGRNESSPSDLQSRCKSNKKRQNETKWNKQHWAATVLKAVDHLSHSMFRQQYGKEMDAKGTRRGKAKKDYKSRSKAPG